ncbi:Uncharacterised protein [Mycobacterium tuberculosis]|uniref:Uncharacterized protein n=1 Tax=Mycobacterium tuberculosis TaxID=1773 RepID=A0A655FUW8_MYCTX|nr:Uncharacterised protein [Mycobacterium tuberculosis]
MAGTPAGLPGRRAAARPAAAAARPDQPPGPLAPGPQQFLVAQQLLRRHGVASVSAGTCRPGRRGTTPARTAQAHQPVRRSLGARGRRRHPVAQAGPVLQRPSQRPGRAIPGPLPRPVREKAQARRTDGRLDRSHADRSGDTPGIRRHQGRVVGPRAVHLLPRGGARAGNRAGGAHRSGSQSAALRSRSSLGRGRQRAHGSIGCVTGRRRRGRWPVRGDHRPIPRLGRHHVAGRLGRRRRRPRHRPRDSAG